MEKNFFPEIIDINNNDTSKEASHIVSTLEGKDISFVEDTPFTFSDTASTYDVFNTRLIIKLVEEV